MTPTRPDVQPTDLLSIVQASRALGVNRSTIYRWIESGKIKAKTRRHNLRVVIAGAEILRIYGATV